MKVSSLHSGFVRSANTCGEKTAVEVDGREYTYSSMHERAASLAATLQTREYSQPDLTAILADRDIDAFEGILGILMSGHGYVPLSPKMPVRRLAGMLERSGCCDLVVGASQVDLACELLRECTGVRRVLLPSSDECVLAAEAGRTIVCRRDFLSPDQCCVSNEVDADSVAYLLFTSGSTGKPKGVMVSHANVRHFLTVMQDRYEITPADRLSQMFELSFDLSVFDMFMAWEVGATVCVPDRGQSLLPDEFIRNSKISIWFSVPSVGQLLLRLRKLAPLSLPSLRISLFCGEPLPCKVAEAWSQAADNSIVENLYGPTEVTLACLLHRWDVNSSLKFSELGSVPIGEPYPGLRALILDENLAPVAIGTIGELLVGGPQVTLGYLNDAKKTQESFVEIPGRGRFYRTGDLARKSDHCAPIVCRGRVDNQIKLHGHRIELGEIESVLSDITGGQSVVVAQRGQDEAVTKLVAFVLTKKPIQESMIKARLGTQLPAYMVPTRVRTIGEFPHNANGKVDRNALVQQLETEDGN